MDVDQVLPVKSDLPSGLILEEKTVMEKQSMFISCLFHSFWRLKEYIYILSNNDFKKPMRKEDHVVCVYIKLLKRDYVARDAIPTWGKAWV